MDAVLYVTQYAYSIDPVRFLGDPAFDYGNQNSLGFFSPVLGLFLKSFGISEGAFVYVLLMQIVWILVFAFFVRSLLRLNRQSLWILPMVILLTCVFSSGMPFSHIVWFHYLASYVCSRSFSIVLGLVGIIFLLNQRSCLSLLFVLVGTIVHPLTAGWCLPFWFFYFFPKTRTPIVIAAFLFPLSYLLHFGVFDTYPPDWLARPLIRPGYDIVSIYAFLFIFFLLLIKLSRIKRIRSISVSMCLLLAIAFYWDLWGGFGEHILLYQVQPWRALWVPSLVAAPLGICLVKDSFRKYTKKRTVSTRDLGMVLLALSFLVSVHLFSVILVSLILITKRERAISLKGFAWAYGAIIFGGYLMQQYLTWYLQGLPSFLPFSILNLYHVRDSFFVYQFVFTIAFVVFFLKKRCFWPALLLVLSIFLARFMLLPALALFMAFFPKGNKIRFWGGIFIIVLLIVFDGVIDAELRYQFLTQCFSRSMLTTSIMAILSLVSIYLVKRFSYRVILAFLLMSGAFVSVSYGSHAAGVLEKEKQLDQYLYSSIFPQLRERGRVLFLVSGNYLMNPRLQFMTGSYLNEFTRTGSVFYKGHYRATLERAHLLYWRKRAPESNEYIEYATILTKLADADTLIDRIGFLCDEKEIHHLVTDKTQLPFVKEDSTILQNRQKIYLYACP